MMMSERIRRARRRASSYSRGSIGISRRVADLGEELADDLAELFLRDLLFDVFVRAVEVRRIGAEAVGAEERADEDDARVLERRVGLDLLGHFDAELALEVDVDDDQVGARAADEVERRVAGLEVRDVEAEAAEVLAEERAERARLVGDGGSAAARMRRAAQVAALDRSAAACAPDARPA